MECNYCGNKILKTDKFCKNCGSQNLDYEEGSELEISRPADESEGMPTPIPEIASPSYSNLSGTNMRDTSKLSGMQIAIIVFMAAGTIMNSFSELGAISLAWCLPMTLVYLGKVIKGEKVGTAFKICSLLFVSLLGGVLMFLDKSDKENN